MVMDSIGERLYARFRVPPEKQHCGRCGYTKLRHVELNCEFSASEFNAWHDCIPFGYVPWEGPIRARQY